MSDAESRGEGAAERDREHENRGTGRNIAPSAAELSGEGADQAVPRQRSTSEGAPPFDIWRRPASEADRADPTYYDRPVLKEPVWMWAVPAYFYAGGVAGAAATLGAVAQAADGSAFAGLVRRCRWLAAAGTTIGAGLLVYDLGRPARFLNMLRVLRPSSPLSVGSWLLASSGPLAGASALLDGADGAAGALGSLAGATTGALGLPLSSYTAVLLSNTTVPLWHEARRTLPPLFSASAAVAAASLLDLMSLSEAERRVVHRFGTTARVAELAAARALEVELGPSRTVSRPLHEGVGGALWRISNSLTGASLMVSLLGRRQRWTRTASGVLGTAGAVALRFALFYAGKASARDPRATFHTQHADGPT